MVEVRMVDTREMRASFVWKETRGWVAMSKRRKFRFEVPRIPLSTRPFARRSRTCFNWNDILRTFHVSPVSLR